MNSQISVIIPTKDRPYALNKCLNSLLIQTQRPSEILVIDNSVNKSAKEIVNSFNEITKIKIRYINEEKIGSPYTRNRGIKEASYDLMAFIDDDCIADKEWINEIMTTHRNKKNIILQGCVLNGRKKDVLSSVEDFMTKLFFQKSHHEINNNIFTHLIDTKNFAIQKSLINQYRLFFNPIFAQYSIFEDVDFAKRAKLKGIDILYNPKMKIYHHKKAHLLDYIKREFKKGRASYLFQKIWRNYNNQLVKSELQKNQLIKRFLTLQKKKNIKLQKRLIKENLVKKSLYFTFSFYTLFSVFTFINKLGFYYEKIMKLFNAYKSLIQRQ